MERGARPASGAPIRSPWPPADPLLPPLDEEKRRLLDMFSVALEAARPLRAAHRRRLPDDVAALSRLLTVERADLRRSYWSSPGLVSAYVHYFLPWNIVRLTRLLQAVALPMPRLWLDRGMRPWLADVGSGPLTVPLALWLARPDWRALPLRILALDSAALPMDLGIRLLEEWARAADQPMNWKIVPVRGPLEHLPRHVRDRLRSDDGKDAIWLLSAANVLNELYGRGDGFAPDDDDDDDGDGDGEGAPPSIGRLPGVLDAMAPLLEPAAADGPEPAALFVEPGTRLGGKTIMRLRALALEGGLRTVAPCPHDAVCPLTRGHRNTWCHFTFDGDGAPGWLRGISAEAGLLKTGLSLAPLLLTAGEPRRAAGLRVLSSPFRVPELDGQARYACTENGLVLLERAEAQPSGAFLPVPPPPADAPRDARSGARILRAPGRREAGRRDAGGRDPDRGGFGRRPDGGRPADGDSGWSGRGMRDGRGRPADGRDMRDEQDGRGDRRPRPRREDARPGGDQFRNSREDNRRPHEMDDASDGGRGHGPGPAPAPGGRDRRVRGRRVPRQA